MIKRLIAKIRVSKTWIVLLMFLGDGVTQIIRGGGFHLDPSLAALTAAALGLKTYKEVTAAPITKDEQVG